MNSTLQSLSQIFPMPRRLCVNPGIIYMTRRGTDREAFNASSNSNTSSSDRLPTCSPTIVLSGQLPAKYNIPLLSDVSPTFTHRLGSKRLERAPKLNPNQNFRPGRGWPRVTRAATKFTGNGIKDWPFEWPPK